MFLVCNLEDLAWLTSMASLKNSHALSYLEELGQFLCMNLDSDRDLVECLDVTDLLFVD